MKAYKSYLTIKNPKRVILSDVPFRSGQRVEVLLLAADDDRDTQVQELQALFKSTQSLPKTRAIREEDIAEEIEAYRSGK